MCACWIHMALDSTQQMTTDRLLEWDAEKNVECASDEESERARARARVNEDCGINGLVYRSDT